MNTRGLFLFLLSILVATPSFAIVPELSWYLFENRGRAKSGKMLLEDKNNPVKVPVEWFDWNCLIQKQKDGILMDCRRGNEFVETKIYCDLPGGRFGRLVRFGKGDNFITFEARCSNLPDSRQSTGTKKASGSKAKAKLKLPPIAPGPTPLPDMAQPTIAEPEPPESPVGVRESSPPPPETPAANESATEPGASEK